MAAVDEGQHALALALPPTASGDVRNSTAFTDNMRIPVHRWFRYSAGFSAEWAEQIIVESGAQRVLDPFAGSGTTVLAAESAGVAGIGVDIHPFVGRIAQAKLRWRADPDRLRRHAEAVVEHARSLASVQLPTSSLVLKCFRHDSLESLVRLRDAVRDLADADSEFETELLWLALVSILRVCSPVGTAQWQYVLPNKSKASTVEPFAAFQERISVFVSDMRARQARNLQQHGRFHIDDARELTSVPDRWADLVLTSPPYANNYDYADAARLEMSFLGDVSGWGDLKPLRDRLMKSCSQQMGRWDPAVALESDLLRPILDELLPAFEALDAERRVKAGNKAYHLMAAAYFLDTARILTALRRKTERGARVCYVVGDSAPYGVHLPVEKWTGELAVAAGFRSWSFEVARVRNVKWKNRKHRVPLHEGRLWIEG